MQLPDTHDTDPALWRKLLANLGGTASENDDRRAVLVKILTALTA